jgi:hypothetical protein
MLPETIEDRPTPLGRPMVEPLLDSYAHPNYWRAAVLGYTIGSHLFTPYVDGSVKRPAVLTHCWAANIVRWSVGGRQI